MHKNGGMIGAFVRNGRFLTCGILNVRGKGACVKGATGHSAKWDVVVLLYSPLSSVRHSVAHHSADVPTVPHQTQKENHYEKHIGALLAADA